MMKPFLVASILLLTPMAVHAQETVAVARDLYTSANYEDALAVLARLDSPSSQPADRMAINQYKAFCLLALGRMPEAERAIEAVLSVDLLYRPNDAGMSPRLRAAFAAVRQRMLPAVVQLEYARAKTAFDRQDFPAAVAQFDRVLQALADPDLGPAGQVSPLSDLRTLAAGFRDLSVRAATPMPVPKPVPMPSPAATVVAAAPVIKGIYSGTEPGVKPASVLKQVLPAFPRELMAARRDGVLEVVINESGVVESAVMRTSIHPRYDQLVMTAAKTWKYQPAMLGRTPVKFRKFINISIKPNT